MSRPMALVIIPATPSWSSQTGLDFTNSRESLMIGQSDFATDTEMEQINVTRAARNLSQLLDRIAGQGASFELTRGGRRIACLVPPSPPTEMKVADLNALFARLPRLDPDDIDTFVRDIGESEGAVAPDRDPWS